MYLLKYNRSYNENIIRLQKDLTLLINNILPEKDLANLQNECNESYEYVQNYIDEYFLNYINQSICYYNKIKNIFDDLENFNLNIDKYQLNYEITFEIDLEDVISINDLLNNNIFVPEISFYEIKLCNGPNFVLDDKFISNNIKKYDYEKFTEKFDCNYLFEIYEFPYFIVSIKQNNEYIQQSSFYEEKKLFLKNSISNEIICFNFNTNLIYYNYALDINSEHNNNLKSDSETDSNSVSNISYSESEPNYESESNYESEYDFESEYDKKPHKFLISKNNIIVYDGPLYNVKKHVNTNIIILDDIEYQILHEGVETTINVQLLYNLMNLV